MTKFYTEYGKFIIHFEEICFRLNYVIRQICTKGNLFGKEDKQVEILLQGLTAQPILTKFRSILITTEYYKDEAIMEMVELFYKNFLSVVEYRNLFAHGTFFYGDPHGNDNVFQVRNTKLNKKGFYDNTILVSYSSVQQLNKDILRLRDFIGRLSMYIKDSCSGKPVASILSSMQTSISGLKIDLKIEGRSIQL